MVLGQLHGLLGSYTFLAESVWMARALPLLTGNVVKIVDLLAADGSEASLFQLPATREADIILTIADAERQAVQDALPGKEVLAVPIDYDALLDPGRATAPRLVCAIPDTAENRLALADFLRFAWPRIRRAVPEAELVVIGEIGETIESRHLPGVNRVDANSDVAPIYRAARAAISPASGHTGIRPETVEAIAHLRPIVTWPAGAYGANTAHSGPGCITVNDWFEFARRTSDLLTADHSEATATADADDRRPGPSPAATYRALVETIARLGSSHAPAPGGAAAGVSGSE